MKGMARNAQGSNRRELSSTSATAVAATRKGRWRTACTIRSSAASLLAAGRNAAASAARCASERAASACLRCARWRNLPITA